MKYSVFLVEDEISSRELLRNGIDWVAAGFEYLGDAADGELALTKVLALKPDILITDIQLPFMDGLTLTKAVQKSLPAIQIIIISGYDYFSYAKEAMELGVKEYILKPFSSQDVLAAVQKVTEQDLLKQELLSKKIAEQAGAQTQEMALSRFINSLIDDDAGSRSSEYLLQAEKLQLLYNMYSLRVLFFRKRRMELAQAIQALCSKNDIRSFLRSDYELVFLLTANEAEALRYEATLLDEILQGELGNEITQEQGRATENEQFLFWCSLNVSRISEIAGQYRVFFDTKKAYLRSFEKIESKQNQSSNAVDKQNKEMNGLEQANVFNEERIRQFLSYGDSHQTENFWKDLLRPHENALQSLIYRSYFLGNIISLIRSFVSQHGYTDLLSIPSNTQIESVVLATATNDALLSYLSRLTRELFSVRDQNSEVQRSSLEGRTIALICSDYHVAEMGVAYLAEKLKLSSNYLSTLFRNKTGHTITQFVLQTRIDRAQELLRDTDLAVTEISSLVGFNNPNYFSTQFKKVSGDTPYDYRQKSREQHKA